MTNKMNSVTFHANGAQTVSVDFVEVHPAPPTLQMKPMQSDDGTKGWFIDGPDFYCDIDKKPGESYEVFIRDKDGVEGFLEGKAALPVQPAERNFCERCGQRLGDSTYIHTCTLPIDATYDSLLNSVKATP